MHNRLLKTIKIYKFQQFIFKLFAQTEYRADRCVNICEMKFIRSEYEMDDAERNKIENRILQFQNHAESRKSIRLTLVTSYGLKRNTHSSIVQNEITLADLMR